MSGIVNPNDTSGIHNESFKIVPKPHQSRTISLPQAPGMERKFSHDNVKLVVEKSFDNKKKMSFVMFNDDKDNGGDEQYFVNNEMNQDYVPGKMKRRMS
jgi:hypothetical protein